MPICEAAQMQKETSNFDKCYTRTGDGREWTKYIHVFSRACDNNLSYSLESTCLKIIFKDSSSLLFAIHQEKARREKGRISL